MKQTTPCNRGIHPVLAFAALLLLSLPHGRGALADTSVWEVSKGDARLYLGGTIHALRTLDFPLPEEFDFAFAAADEIYFEADLKAAMDPAFQATTLALGSYNDGRSLDAVLSEEVYTDFYTLAGRFGIPAGALDQFKPGVATATLVMLVLGNFGYTAQGVEMHFIEQADRDGLAQGYLETLEYQAKLIAELGEGNEDAMVADFLDQAESAEGDMNEMVSAWREGDIDKIDELMLTDMAERFPEDFEAMFTRRNRNWLPPIMEMLNDADTEFVLVGVGHMPGEDGLLELLRREGAAVRPLNLPERSPPGSGSGTGFVAQNDLARAAGGSLTTYPGWDLLYFSASFQKVRDMLGQVFPSVLRGHFFL